MEGAVDWLTPSNITLMLNGIVVVVGGFVAKDGIKKLKTTQTKAEIEKMIDVKIYPVRKELEEVRKKADKNEMVLDTKFDELNKTLTTMATDLAYIKGKADGSERK